jgi:hypothetical protein
MYKGHPCVFLSCSEKFKESVARPLKEGLADAGVYGVIVSDEPHPDGVRPDPTAKVDYFLDRCDAVAALCTPDDHLNDGTVQPRQNIIDELQRAWGRDHLATRVQTLKERTVRLPSNINPTYDPLDLDEPVANLKLVLRQLAEWGVLPALPASAAPAAVRPGDLISGLLDGLELGDWVKSERRVLESFGSLSKHDQAEVVRQLTDYLFATADQTQMHTVAMVMEQAVRLDPALVPVSVIERLAADEADPRRMCAANLLWERATASPGDVPLDILRRLAAPAREDWYVFAPALACLRELVLHRPAAGMVVRALAASTEVEDRREAAQVIRDVAEVQPKVVGEDMISWFASDTDPEVRATITQASQRAGLPDGKRPRRGPGGWFGI